MAKLLLNFFTKGLPDPTELLFLAHIQAHLIPSVPLVIQQLLRSSYCAPDTGIQRQKCIGQNLLGYVALTKDPETPIALYNLFLT